MGNRILAALSVHVLENLMEGARTGVHDGIAILMSLLGSKKQARYCTAFRMFSTPFKSALCVDCGNVIATAEI